MIFVLACLFIGVLLAGLGSFPGNEALQTIGALLMAPLGLLVAGAMIGLVWTFPDRWSRGK